MKKLYTILASAILVVGCSEVDITDGASTNSSATKAITIEVNSSPSSRVAIDNSDENWSLTWCEGDALSSLLIDGEGYTSINSSYFVLAAEDISSDGIWATISGDVDIDSEQMILLYPANNLLSSAGEYCISLPDNVIDMGAPYASLGSFTPLVSDNISLADGASSYSTTMHHLATVLEMGVNIVGLDENYDYNISSLMISTISDKSFVPNTIYINPEKSYGDDGFAYYNDSSYGGGILATITSCPVTNNTPVVIPISVFPFELEADGFLNVNIILEAKDKEGENEAFLLNISENIYNTSNQTISFEAGTYNTIKHTYDFAERVEYYSNTWITRAALSFDGGDGSAASPYEIATAEQLARLTVLSYNQQINDNFILTQDIDLADYKWLGAMSFYGVFDGQYHSITSLNGEEPLFSSIKDATLCRIDVQGELSESSVGGSITQTAENSQIYDCSSALSQSCELFAAGILGYSVGDSNIITNCYNTASLTSGYVAGGIVGCVDSSIKIVNCYNTADISAPYAGGVLGYAVGTSDTTLNIRSSYNVGAVSGSGIIGLNTSSQVTLDACYSTQGDDTDANGKAMPDTNSSLATALNSSAARYNSTVDTSAGDVKAWAWEVNDGYPTIKTGYVPIVINAGFE